MIILVLNDACYFVNVQFLPKTRTLSYLIKISASSCARPFLARSLAGSLVGPAGANIFGKLPGDDGFPRASNDPASLIQCNCKIDR